MIGRIAGAIIERLEDMNLFRAVGRSIRKQVLQNPPAAAVILAADMEDVDDPVVRELAFDIVIAVPTPAQEDGSADDLVDAVRNAFVGAVILGDGGVFPASVPRAVLEGFEANLAIYTVQVLIKGVPAVVDSQQ